MALGLFNVVSRLKSYRARIHRHSDTRIRPTVSLHFLKYGNRLKFLTVHFGKFHYRQMYFTKYYDILNPVQCYGTVGPFKIMFSFFVDNMN
jgi:hypothetical protein